MLLLEAGGPDTAPEIHIPAMFPLVFKSSLDWDLLGESEPGLGGRRLYLPRGRVIGGSRLDQRDDLPARQPRRLRRLGGGRLHRLVVRRGAPVLQALRGQRARRERVPRRRRPARGLRQPLHAPADRGAARGGRAAGYAHIEDLNVDRPEGVSRFQLTQRNGMRCSTADAFLHPAEGRPNLEVRSGVFVERIVFEGDRAVGVELVATASARPSGPSAR